VVANDAREVFAALVSKLIERSTGRGWDYLLIGLHETDPLLPVLRGHTAAWYTTRLYLVCWADGEAVRLSLDGRPAYLELGSL
jgi:hypothetical protein